MNRNIITDAMERFISQRSGIDFRNYADRPSAMEDYRRILRHGSA